MAQEQRKVVPLPVLKGSTIGDAMNGFAAQIEQNEHLGTRVEEAATAVAVEIRGWEAVARRIGADPAERLRSQVLDRALEALDAGGGTHVAVGGSASIPVITATFAGEQHAMRGVVTAQRLRDLVARSLHPSISERFHACVGVNSGTVVHTRVNGTGLEFSAKGTVTMFATRLQEFAGPDQIFLSASTVQAVGTSAVDVVPIGPVRTNGDGEQAEAYSLVCIGDRAANS